MNSLLTAIKAFVLKNRPAYKDDLGNGKYDVKKLPEECVPDSVNNKIRIAQNKADSAYDEASSAYDEANLAYDKANLAYDKASDVNSRLFTLTNLNYNFQTLEYTSAKSEKIFAWSIRTDGISDIPLAESKAPMKCNLDILLKDSNNNQIGKYSAFDKKIVRGITKISETYRLFIDERTKIGSDGYAELKIGYEFKNDDNLWHRSTNVNVKLPSTDINNSNISSVFIHAWSDLVDVGNYAPWPSICVPLAGTNDAGVVYASDKTDDQTVPVSIDKNGYLWCKGSETLPKDGNPGDILVKTETGSVWQKQEPATSTPDWNQNDPTASDYIKNRPGGYTVNYPALNIEWDGVIGDRVSVDADGMKFVKVSDEIPKAEQLVGGTFTVKDGNASNTINIADNDIIDLDNGIYGGEMFLVVNKAPANLVNPNIGAVMAVFSETGVYFVYMDDGNVVAYASSLVLPAKSEIVPIPGELTNIVGGYVRAERNEPLIDEVVPASSFELYTTSSETYYEAPITLGFTPADGDLIRGTINGVEVNGQWNGRSKYAYLYRVGNRDVPFCAIGFRSEKAIISLQQDSAPTTDYEIHLYRYVPADIVQIPQEYVEGLEATTSNASEALSTANTAKSTAESAQSTANTAKSAAESAQNTANTAKSTAESAQNTADAAKSTADTAKSTADTAVKPSKQGENICWYLMKNPYSQYNTVDTLIGSTGGTALEIIVNEKYPSVAFVPPAYGAKQANFEFRRSGSVYPHPLITGIGGIVVYSSTAGSTKKFKITVDDTGTISATEVT